MHTLQAALRIGFTFALLLGVAGCGGPALSDKPLPSENVPTAEKSPPLAPPLRDGKPIHGPAEVWEALYSGDAKVGHAHTTTKTVEENGQTLIEISVQQQIRIDRFGTPVVQKISVVGRERPDGTPVSFVAKVDMNPGSLESRGTWHGDKLKITATVGGRAVEKTIDWQADFGGPFAGEQSLRAKPLQPGEKRTLKVLYPTSNVIGDMIFEAGEYETTALGRGEAKLLKVQMTQKVGGAAVKGVQWCDEHGEILKQYIPQVNQVSYRTTKEEALGKDSGGLDLGNQTIVRIDLGRVDPHRAKSITYRATLKDNDIEGVFSHQTSQQVKLLDQRTAELTIRHVSPSSPAELPGPETPPTDDDKAANGFIQSDAPEVVALANSVAKDEADPWKIATALERLVKSTITKKNFAQAFLSASETLKSKSGDCTEHAVLLCAAARARGIPARTAMGLVYFPEARGFAYHMWSEVWIGDRWVPLDATLGRGGIGATHIKIGHASLKGADATTALLPVMSVLGQLKLEIAAAN